jgi:hypothetical protein
MIAIASAMSVQAQVSVGASIGGLLSKPQAHITDQSQQLTIPTGRRVSITGGILMDLPIGESGFRLMPEIRYADKGFLARTEVALQQNKVAIDIAQHMGFFELGVPFGFATGLGEHHAFLGVGPYASVAIAGKRKTTISMNAATNETTETLSFGSGTNQLDRIDYGAEATGGIVLSSGLYFKIAYSFGLPDLSNDPASPLRQRCAFLSAGYFFLR